MAIATVWIKEAGADKAMFTSEEIADVLLRKTNKQYRRLRKAPPVINLESTKTESEVKDND